jgi:hypothetical protein
LTGTGLHEIH